MHRVEGQVRGIEKMIADDPFCVDILQVAAVGIALELSWVQLQKGPGTIPSSEVKLVDEPTGNGHGSLRRLDH